MYLCKRLDLAKRLPVVRLADLTKYTRLPEHADLLACYHCAMQGRTYLCKRLDLGERLAVVRSADLKYYTKTRDFCDVHVIGGRALLPHNVRHAFVLKF